MTGEKAEIVMGFLADIINGNLHIYPQTEEAEAALMEFINTGVNEQVGAIYLKVKDGVPLEKKKLVFMQVTKKGTPLGGKKEIKSG